MVIPGVDVPMLEINPVEFNDFGNYICVASINVFGVVNETESDEATLFGNLLTQRIVTPLCLLVSL